MNNRIPETIKHLIIINAIFFITSKVLTNYNLFDALAMWFPENKNFRIWQIFTHMFMHHPTFYLHILMNMFGLWMFGSPLEQMWGKNKFLFFYISSGLGAVFLPLAIDYYQFNDYYQQLISSGLTGEDIHSILTTGNYGKFIDLINLSNDQLSNFYTIYNKSSLGASGAIMGLIAAFGISFPNAKMALIFLPIPIAAKYFIPLILMYEIYSGITGGSSMFGVNVAHFAHVGGALTGAIIAWYWKKNQFRTL